MQVSTKNLLKLTGILNSATEYDVLYKTLEELRTEAEFLKGELVDQKRECVIEHGKQALLDLLSTLSFECDVDVKKRTITFIFPNTGLSYTTYVTNFSQMGSITTCTIFDNVRLVIAGCKPGLCTCQDITYADTGVTLNYEHA